jgi:predicted SAM-dependent methyltransferase
MNREIAQYLEHAQPPRLQLGSGGNIIEGWLNTDGQCDGWFDPRTVKLDAGQPFDIDSCTFDYVFTEHMIEHLDYAAGQRCLQESFRVLRPGGRIRVGCPDFAVLVEMYTNPTELMKEYMTQHRPDWAPRAEAIFTINNFVRAWGHQFIYDQPTLTASLASAGFVNIEYFKIRESRDPVLQNLEAEWRMPPGHLQLETMTFEAVKPSAN